MIYPQPTILNLTAQGNIDAAPHLLRKKLDLPTWYPNLEIKSKIEKTFWRLGQSTFFPLNKMRWVTILEVFDQELSQLQRDSCLGLLPSYGLNPLLAQRQNRQKESWSWCRSRFLAGFRNHGSRQQRHLADTYKASSDQPFHQRSEQEWAFCLTPSASPPPMLRLNLSEKSRLAVGLRPTIPSTVEVIGEKLCSSSSSPSDPSFLANDFICAACPLAFKMETWF